MAANPLPPPGHIGSLLAVLREAFANRPQSSAALADGRDPAAIVLATLESLAATNAALAARVTQLEQQLADMRRPTSAEAPVELPPAAAPSTGLLPAAAAKRARTALDSFSMFNSSSGESDPDDRAPATTEAPAPPGKAGEPLPPAILVASLSRSMLSQPSLPSLPIPAAATTPRSSRRPAEPYPSASFHQDDRAAGATLTSDESPWRAAAAAAVATSTPLPPRANDSNATLPCLPANMSDAVAPSTAAHPVVTISGYTADERTRLVPIITALGGTFAPPQPEHEPLPPAVTHVVCPPGLRTARALGAMVSRRWVVAHTWLEASRAEGTLVAEAAHGGRLARGPFEGKTLYFSPGFLQENEMPRGQDRLAMLRLLFAGAGAGTIVSFLTPAVDYFLAGNRESAAGIAAALPPGTVAKVLRWTDFLALIPTVDEARALAAAAARTPTPAAVLTHRGGTGDSPGLPLEPTPRRDLPAKSAAPPVSGKPSGGASPRLSLNRKRKAPDAAAEAGGPAKVKHWVEYDSLSEL